jgi:hypothetical protein
MKNRPWIKRWRHTDYYMNVFFHTGEFHFRGPGCLSEPWELITDADELKQKYDLYAAITDGWEIAILPNDNLCGWIQSFPEPPSWCAYKRLGDAVGMRAGARHLSFRKFRGWLPDLEKDARYSYARTLQRAIEDFVSNPPCWGRAPQIQYEYHV